MLKDSIRYELAVPLAFFLFVMFTFFSPDFWIIGPPRTLCWGAAHVIQAGDTYDNLAEQANMRSQVLRMCNVGLGDLKPEYLIRIPSKFITTLFLIVVGMMVFAFRSPDGIRQKSLWILTPTIWWGLSCIWFIYNKNDWAPWCWGEVMPAQESSPIAWACGTFSHKPGDPAFVFSPWSYVWLFIWPLSGLAVLLVRMEVDRIKSIVTRS